MSDPLHDVFNEKTLSFFAGVAGAAALAATDWRSKWRFAQHVFVGTVSSAIGTPAIFPILAKFLNILEISDQSKYASASFIVGAFAIYLFEYVLAFIRAKSSITKKEKRKDIYDDPEC